MPIYDYVDRNSKKELGILRRFEAYKEPPTKEEALEAGLTEEEYEEADWDRVIGAGIQVTKSDSWGPGKGNW